jgi:hypothetical protein
MKFLSVIAATIAIWTLLHGPVSAEENSVDRGTEEALSQPLTGEQLQTANVEAVVNIVANFLEISAFTVGGPTIGAGIALLFLPDRKKFAPLLIVGGFAITIVGLAAPGIGLLLMGKGNHG